MNILNDQNWTPHLLETKGQVTYFFKKYPIQGEVIKSISVLGHPTLISKKELLWNYYEYGFLSWDDPDYEEKKKKFLIERNRKRQTVQCYEEIPRDAICQRRAISVDSIVLIQFESGNQLEIDMSKYGVIYMAMNQLPHDTVLEDTKRHMIQGNLLFSPLIGKLIESYEVRSGEITQYYEEFMNHVKDRKNCLTRFELKLSDDYILLFACNLDMYSVVCIHGEDSMELTFGEFVDAVEVQEDTRHGRLENDFETISPVFEAAKNYEFECVKEYLLKEDCINQLSPTGSSLFTTFVSGYYDSFEYSEDNESEAFFHPEVLLPLSERQHPIEQQLLFLLSKGADPNLILLNDGTSELALQYAVANLDIPMVKFLLDHGADPKVWVSLEEKEEVIYPYSRWNMDELDIQLINGASRHKEAYCLIIQMAVLLAQNGIEEYRGVILRVSKKDRAVRIHSTTLLNY